jgi:hypothetical protein
MHRMQSLNIFGSYLTGNTLRRRYKAQPVNSLWGKESLFTARTILNAQIHYVGQNAGF